MTLSKLGEFGLIEKIRKATPRGRGVRLGIGDDAAWLKCIEGSFLITSDLLVEGIHFDLRWTSFYELGYKTVAINLSDVAAMGGQPSYLTLSLGIPLRSKTRHVEEFYRGIQDLALQTGVALVGGDTSASDIFFISACLIGHAPYGAISRAGAKPGDDIYVTGTLGDSALGLELLRKNPITARKGERAFLAARHLLPTARVKAGLNLAKEKLAKAMIDISDGLLQDLGHVCKASGIGAVIWWEALPLSRAHRLVVRKTGSFYALGGGEDYELLFCLRPRDRTRLERIKKRLGVPLTHIGKCVSSRDGIKVVGSDGRPIVGYLGGYDHFKTKSNVSPPRFPSYGKKA